MVYDFFERTALDAAFYEERLRGRLPSRILDAHAHLSLPEHWREVGPERIRDNWAIETGIMSAEDAAVYYGALFPGQRCEMTGFAFPVREVALDENNDYVASRVGKGLVKYAMMAIRPTDAPADIEAALRGNAFCGVKPYPDQAPRELGSEVSLFDFMTREQFALAESLGKVVMMHLPRAKRMLDENNIRELQEIARDYPALKMVIAHMGRCSTPLVFRQAIEALGDAAAFYYYDTAMEPHPVLIEYALTNLPRDRVLFGTDLPIFTWHGKRTWTETSYTNLLREDLSWNKHKEGPDAEAKYTLYIYEQVNNILNAMERAGLGETGVERMFYANADALYSSTF